MYKISLITPVYNSEKYLNECIDSVLNQTFEDFELILIDDGSTDNSSEICDSYAVKDSRVKVVHKENAGMGASYNLGMDKAEGEYIGFLESDDFMHVQMLENLYTLAVKHNKPDIIKSAWFRYYTSANTVEKDCQLAEYNSWNKFSIQSCPSLLTRQFSVWSAIYKKDFIRNKNIRYLETPGASYQDVSFSIKVFCQSDSIVITPDAYVYYRQDNENSSINSKGKVNAILVEYEEVDKFFAENPDIKEWANTDKLIKQYYDYNWNYYRIAEHLRHILLKGFASDFKKYRDNGELKPEFYARIDAKSLNSIMNLY